jgi:hypothetical protein
MPDFSMEDIKVKLETDSDGIYKKWLIKRIQDYKNQYGHLKQGFSPPDIYKKLDALDGALDAALTVISQYQKSKTQSSVRTEEIAFSTLFCL